MTNRVQQISLASIVSTDKNIQAWLKLNPKVFERAKVLDIDGGEMHDGRPGVSALPSHSSNIVEQNAMIEECLDLIAAS